MFYLSSVSDDVAVVTIHVEVRVSDVAVRVGWMPQMQELQPEANLQDCWRNLFEVMHFFLRFFFGHELFSQLADATTTAPNTQR